MKNRTNKKSSHHTKWVQAWIGPLQRQAQGALPNLCPQPVSPTCVESWTQLNHSIPAICPHGWASPTIQHVQKPPTGPTGARGAGHTAKTRAADARQRFDIGRRPTVGSVWQGLVGSMWQGLVGSVWQGLVGSVCLGL